MSARTNLKILVVAGALGGVGFLVFRLFDPVATAVAVAGETEEVPNDGDSADDPAIWVDPFDPERSLILGTDKSGGLGVYGLGGQQLQFIDGGERFNNVDVRDGFPLSGVQVPIVAAGETTRQQLALFTIAPDTRQLVEIPRSRINLGIDPEGLALYRSAAGDFSVFVVGDDRESNEDGVIEQWSIQAGDRYPIDFARVRRLVVGDTAEGMVADDRAGQLYVAEETVGIWRYPADPDDSAQRELVAEVNFGDGLRADVEGLTILHRPEASFLLASSQGSNDFVVYRIGPRLERIGRFEVNGHDGVDGVSHTDGIDVVGAALGPRFPSGLFVCQDDKNPNGNQNFKLVSVAKIEQALGLSPIE